MLSRLRVGLACIALTIAACTTAPTPSAVSEVCSDDLPPRTSPTDYPVAVLHAAGDDLPPVVGDVEWLGDGEPVAFSPPRAVHMERFTVLQVNGQSEFSIRMSDGVGIATWTIEAVPSGSFRSGDSKTGRTTWAEGNEPIETICVPLRDGSWVVIADITFDGEAGGGTFYWRLNVVETSSG